MNYYIVNCQIRSYEDGVMLTVCDNAGRMLGDIAATPRKKVDKIDLIKIMKDLMKPDESFELLMRRAINTLKPYVETIDIKLVF